MGRSTSSTWSTIRFLSMRTSLTFLQGIFARPIAHTALAQVLRILVIVRLSFGLHQVISDKAIQLNGPLS